jgi:tol-pal system protein YbgF
MGWRAAATGLALIVAGLPAMAQDATLADIRQQLAALYQDISALQAQLDTSPQAVIEIGGPTAADRLRQINDLVLALSAKTEELEFRINRITVDGTNRIGDLEFRICELEPGCDIGALGDTPTLGGVDSGAQVPVAADPSPGIGPQLAVGEQADFDRAQAALTGGDFQTAVNVLTAFTQTYPGSPLTGQVLYLRGQALEGLGQTSDAARSYLDSFSGDPSGPVAADALYKLGVMLGQLGQVPDACVTLNEVLVRFPGNPAALEAQTARAGLACP